MSINFKKLKSQIKREVRNGEQGWFFQPTKEQSLNDIDPIFYAGKSKNRFIDILLLFYLNDFKF